MSFLKGLIDSLGSVFSDSAASSESHPNSSAPNSSTMDGIAGPGASVSNERVAYKLKGYFDLAKEEIAKAVRAEEWGLVDDAVGHYNSAQRILVEASSTPVPSFISTRFSILTSISDSIVIFFAYGWSCWSDLEANCGWSLDFGVCGNILWLPIKVDPLYVVTK